MLLCPSAYIQMRCVHTEGWEYTKPHADCCEEAPQHTDHARASREKCVKRTASTTRLLTALRMGV